MNVEHFRAFVWLRWRLFVNRMRRGGAVNAAFTIVFAVAGVLLSTALALVAFCVGLFLLPLVRDDLFPSVLLYVWDGLVVAFLFGWTVGVFVELQRSEPLSLEKFLHLPVSLTSAFFINYLSSLLTFSMIVFLPAMLALALGLVLARGPGLLAVLPLLAAFFLMVTALTYQFQGWLASLMVNPRRRRTVIVLVTMAFILSCQLPNVLNALAFRPWAEHMEADPQAELFDKLAALQRSRDAGEITAEEFETRRDEMQREANARTDDRYQQLIDQVQGTSRLLNLVLPPGWLPLGATAAAKGEFLPPLLCFAGMTALGSFCLWRAYRTTVRLYTGQFNRGGRRALAPAPTAAAPAKAAGTRVGLLERRLPWLSEEASAVALAAFRSLTRAPEAKMMLLSPLILVLVFGSMLLSGTMNPPESVRPLLANAAVAMVLVSMVQFIGNQFGFDRSGFRVYVLSAAPRRDILLGKNLSAAPLALGMSAVLIAVLEVFCRLRIDHLLAVPFQAVLMYLLFCAVANWMSIFSPMAIKPGSFRASNPKGVGFLLQLLFTLFFPLAFAPALLPLGVETGLEALGWVRPGVPVCLILSVLECAAAAYVYSVILAWQGRVLQAREKKILEVVAAKAE